MSRIPQLSQAVVALAVLCGNSIAHGELSGTNDQTLLLPGLEFVHGEFFNNGALANTGTFTNTGFVQNSVDALFENRAGGTVVNAGAFRNEGHVSNSGVFQLAPCSTPCDRVHPLTNVHGATIENQVGGVFAASAGNIDNRGTLINRGQLTLADSGQLASSRGGTITNALGATLSNDNLSSLPTNLNELLRELRFTGFQVSLSGELTNAGTIVNNGTMSFGDRDSPNSPHGDIINTADGLISNRGVLVLAASEYVDLPAVNTAGLVNDGQLENTGSLVLFSDDASQSSLKGTGVYRQQAGQTHIYNAQDRVVQSAVDIEGGVLSGDGTVVAPLTIGAAARLQHGGSAGTLSVEGDLHVAGTVGYELSGVAANYDGLDVTGEASFDASAQAVLKFTGPVHVGDSYGLVSAAHLVGWEGVGIASNAHGLAFVNHTDAAQHNGQITITGITGVGLLEGELSGAYFGDNHIDGQATVNAELFNNGALANAGTFTNTGFVQNSVGGLISNTPGGTLLTTDLGSLVNNGRIENAGNLQISGELSGTGSYLQTDGQTTIDGTMAQREITIDGGTLLGNGSITGDVFLENDAILAPGHSPGSLTIVGDLHIGEQAGLNIELASAGQFDTVTVTGQVQLGGILTVSSFGDYLPQLGASFEFFQFGQATGSFADIRAVGFSSPVSFRVFQLQHSLRLEAVVVPLPATGWLLLGSCVVLAGRVRRAGGERRGLSPTANL